MFSWPTLGLQLNTIMVSVIFFPNSHHKDPSLPSTPLPLACWLLITCFVSGTRLKHIIGSSFYIAPSVLQQSYGTEADLWSLGIVLYVLLSGCPPFVGKSNKETFQKIMNDPLDFKHSRFNNVSLEAKHLISKLLTRSPEDKRMTESDILGDVMCCLSVM